MSIEVTDQYYLEVSIADKKDFLSESDLKEFTIIEQAGNVLPKYELSFSSNDEELIALLNDGNTMNVQFGKSREDVADVKLNIGDLKSYRSSETEHEFKVTGILGHIAYANASKIKCSDKKSGVEVIAETVKESGFKFEGNISTSRDSQNWVQYNITSKNFVSQVALHSYLSNSFIATGITIDSRFVLKDIKKEVEAKNSKPDWRLIKDVSKDNDIDYVNQYIVENNSGFMNAMLANGKNMNINSLTDANYSEYSPEITPILALTQEVIRSKEMGKKYAGTKLQTGNAHDKYWEAYQNNLAKLASLSSFKLTVPCGNKYFPIKVLDVVFFKDSSTTNVNLANEYLTGLYLVSKVVRTIKGKALSTFIEICRESPNLVRNDAS
jgi:hypothetical protein